MTPRGSGRAASLGLENPPDLVVAGLSLGLAASLASPPVGFAIAICDSSRPVHPDEAEGEVRARSQPDAHRRRGLGQSRAEDCPPDVACFTESMSGDERGEVAGRSQEGAQDGAQERAQERRLSEQERPVAGGSGPAQTAAKEREPEWEDPEEYADPICVCEPEPYWQEVAEQLEREKRARAEASSQEAAPERSSPAEPR